MCFTVRAAVLTAMLMVCLETVQAHARAATPRVCAGYPVLSDTELGPVPQGTPVTRIDVNADGAVDLIVAYPKGGGALYLNCGDGLY